MRFTDNLSNSTNFAALVIMFVVNVYVSYFRSPDYTRPNAYQSPTLKLASNIRPINVSSPAFRSLFLHFIIIGIALRLHSFPLP